MASVSVSQETDGKPQSVFKKVQKYCDEKLILREIGNLKPTVEWEDKKRLGTFKEKGVDGTISVSGSGPCTITITMNIPLFLLPFKGIITDSIQRHLAKFA